MKNPYILGERVYLRPLESDDAATLQPWLNDREVTRNLVVYRPMTLADEQDFIDRSRRDTTALVLGIVARSADRLIGTTGLHYIDWKNRSAGFGIEIGVKEEWGKGYGGEATKLMVEHAFSTLNLHRVWLMVYEFNLRGLRCYERVGFKREGVLRQYLFADGRYWDAISMSVLREEWGGAAS
jgi:[ribosomal protein S5]-alanine N-acetyltransferase